MSPLNAIHPALSDSLRSVFQFPRVERLHIWSYILKFPATSIIPVLSLCLPGYCVHPVMGIYCSSTEESCAASRSVLKCLFYATAFNWNSWPLCIILFSFFFNFLSPYFHSTGVKEQDWWVFFPAYCWHRITGSPCPQQAGFWSWLCLSLNRYGCFFLSKAAVALYFNLIPYFKPAVSAAKLIT